ncbi:MAG: hypothetical protein AAGD22_10955 [Verrucomicrobiota bacterium]
MPLDTRFHFHEDDPYPFAITLYRNPGAGAIPLGRRIAHYLNEVDPITPGRWLTFDETALEAVLQNPSPPISSPSQKNDAALVSLVSAGAVVIVDNNAHSITINHPRVFHVRLAGSDSPETATTRFHLTVNTKRMSQHTAVRVIADSALEWATHPTHH